MALIGLDIFVDVSAGVAQYETLSLEEIEYAISVTQSYLDAYAKFPAPPNADDLFKDGVAIHADLAVLRKRLAQWITDIDHAHRPWVRSDERVITHFGEIRSDFDKVDHPTT